MSMQKQLEVVCAAVGIQPPAYTFCEMKVINGCPYRRFYASVVTNAIGRPIVSLGRFGKDDYDAKEDVAALLLRRLMVSTGKKIRDLNYYNVQVLEEQLHNTMDANLKLEMELAILNEEFRMSNVG